MFRKLFQLITLSFGMLFYLGVAIGAPGSLDTSFDGDGKVTTPVLNLFDITNKIGVQRDGKIVIVGTFHNFSNKGEFVITRYNTNGSRDMTFGTNGLAVSNFSVNPIDVTARSFAIQSDGKIVVVGESVANYVQNGVMLGPGPVARFNPNGTLDQTFSGDGETTISIGIDFDANDVAIQADGKILVGGGSRGSLIDPSRAFALARLNADGTLDNTFSQDGTLSTVFGESYTTAISAIAIQTDGKIVATGESDVTGKKDLTLARYNLDGTLDANFGKCPSNNQYGIRCPYFGENDNSPNAIMIQRDGKIVIGGTHKYLSEFDGFLARFNTDGSTDTNFGNGGLTISDFGSSIDTLSGISIDRGGKIIVGGKTTGEAGSIFVVARYCSNGQLDNQSNHCSKSPFGAGSFLERGFEIVNDDPETNTGAYGSGVALQQDGKILLGGMLGGLVEGVSSFAVDRFLGDCGNGAFDLGEGCDLTAKVSPNNLCGSFNPCNPSNCQCGH